MTTQPPQHNLSLIRASELGQYGFCHRAWWLGTVKGLPTARQDRLTRGTQHHRRHADQVRIALRWRQAGLVLLSAGGLFLIIAFLISNL